MLLGGYEAARLARDAPQREAPPPMTPGSLLRGYGSVMATRWSRVVLLAALVEGALMFGALAFVPTWLHERTGITLSSAGAVVAAIGVGGLLYASTARRWIAILGERGLVTAGSATIAAGFAMLALAVSFASGTTGWVLEIVACLIAGIGFYMLHNTLQTLATQLAPQARATAVGLFAVALFAGQSIGVALVARLGPAIGYAPVIVGAGVLLALMGAALGLGIARRHT